MSVRLMKNGTTEGSGYVHGMTNLPLIDSPEMCGGDRWFSVEDKKVKVVDKEKYIVRKNRPVALKTNYSSSSASSIGKNSDITGELKEISGETDEVQSPFKSPLDAMDAFEEVLPIRRGISRFYNGKSKSFTSLIDSSSLSSIKHIAKPENAYMKKRRNILASTLAWDKNQQHSSLTCNGRGISKRITYNNSSTRARALAAFAFTMTSSTNNNSSDIIASPVLATRLSPHFEDSPSMLSSSFSSSTRCKNLSAWRSFSLADLQQPGCVSGSCTSPSHVDMNQSRKKS